MTLSATIEIDKARVQMRDIATAFGATSKTRGVTLNRELMRLLGAGYDIDVTISKAARRKGKIIIEVV